MGGVVEAKGPGEDGELGGTHWWLGPCLLHALPQPISAQTYNCGQWAQTSFSIPPRFLPKVKEVS